MKSNDGRSSLQQMGIYTVHRCCIYTQNHHRSKSKMGNKSDENTEWTKQKKTSPTIRTNRNSRNGDDDDDEDEEEMLSWNHELRPLVHNSRLYQLCRGAYQMAKHTKELGKKEGKSSPSNIQRQTLRNERENPRNNFNDYYILLLFHSKHWMADRVAIRL